jgi:uncharacterized protein YqeY
MTMPLRTRLQADLVASMKAREAGRVAALRTALAAIANAEAVEVPVQEGPWRPSETEATRRHLTEEDVRAIVAAELEAAAEGAQEMRALDQHEEADRLAAQADVLEAHLAG